MPRGTVKFFNAAKGFGFISPEEGGADVFVHVSAVQRSGLNSLNDGDQVSFQVEQDRRSGKLAAVDLQVTGSSPQAARRPPSRPSYSDQGYGGSDQGSRGRGGAVGGSGTGTVKWFNGAKGYGFIKPDDGGADLFVHISAVEQAGLSRLEDGQPVAYDLEQDRRSGKTSAVNLQLR